MAQEGYLVARVKFKGNKHISTSALKQQATIGSSNWFARQLWGNDKSYFADELVTQNSLLFTNLYQKEGFLNVRVDTIVKIKGVNHPKVHLYYNIHEGQPVKVGLINFNINETSHPHFIISPSEARLYGLGLKLKPGNRFRDVDLNADKSSLSRIYQNRGYPYNVNAFQLSVDTISQIADVFWDITTGPMAVFGKVSVDGNVDVTTQSILKQVAFKKGERYNLRKLNLTQQQVYTLGLFRVASVKALLTRTHSDTVDVAISVSEAPAWITTLGAGYGEIEKLRLSVATQYLGVWGGIGRLNVKASRSAVEPYNFDVKYTQPAFLNPRGALVANPYWLGQDEPGFRLRKYGSNVGFNQAFTRYFSGNVSLYYEKLYRLSSDSLRLTDFSLQKVNLNKSGLSAGILFDNALPRTDPSEGFYLALSSKRNGLSSSAQFRHTALLTEVRNYMLLSKSIVLATKVKCGFLFKDDGAIIQPQDRLYAGGNASVRGWARHSLGPLDLVGRPLGGNSHLEFSVEPRIKVHSMVTLAIFADAGNVWFHKINFTESPLKVAAGLGIRVRTPVGPVGIDCARPVGNEVKSWQVNLNIGHPF